jgi:hypothetical protein
MKRKIDCWHMLKTLSATVAHRLINDTGSFTTDALFTSPNSENLLPKDSSVVYMWHVDDGDQNCNVLIFIMTDLM